jgi:hypothetical protein
MSTLRGTIDYRLGIRNERQLCACRLLCKLDDGPRGNLSSDIDQHRRLGEKEGKDERVWVFIEVRPTTDNCEMMVRDLEESIYFGKDLLGRGMSRQEALKSDLLDDFFSVADHIVANDPAVKSYLLGERVSAEGRDHLVQ